MSPLDFQTVIEIREELTKTNNTHTKLVINNDYVCECWSEWGTMPAYYDSVQKLGDMVFGTEPHQVSNMVNGAFCIPHPTNTEWLKRLTTDTKSDSIVITSYSIHYTKLYEYLLTFEQNHNTRA